MFAFCLFKISYINSIVLTELKKVLKTVFFYEKGRKDQTKWEWMVETTVLNDCI